MKQSLHILIIDDDPDDTEFLTDAFLKAAPAATFTRIDNGKDALDMLLSPLGTIPRPDLTFLDLHMPAITGYDVLRALQASETAPRNMPVMVISTSMLPAEAEKCIRSGATAYFAKPPSLQGYDELVSDALKHCSRSPV